MDAVRRRLLIVRPADRWENTRTALDGLDIDLAFLEVLNYQKSTGPAPRLDKIDAVIITSPRAFGFLDEAERQLFVDLPFFVVGAETSRALRSMGSIGPHTMAPTGAALATIIKQQPRQKLLHIRGDEVAIDFQKKLARTHDVRTWVTYTSTPITNWPPDIMSDVQAGQFDGVAFFSGAAAKAFVVMARMHDFLPQLARMTAFGLSKSVLGSDYTTLWQNQIVATSPDLSSMARAMASWRHTALNQETTMSQASDADLPADIIIEKFGGIRPMATKIGVPVTTVQGWKKRGTIPANRAHLVEAAAVAHGVEIKNLVRIVDGDTVTHIHLPSADAAASGAAPRATEPTTEPQISEILEQIRAAITEEQKTAPGVAPAAVPVFQRRRIDKITRATWLMVILLSLAVIGALLVLSPGVQKLSTQEEYVRSLQTDIQRLQNQLTEVQSQNAMLTGLVPPDLQDDLKNLRTRAQDIEGAVNTIGTQAKALTEGVLGDGPGSIEQRLSKMEDNVTTLVTTTAPNAWRDYIDRLRVGAGDKAAQAALNQGLKDVMTAFAASGEAIFAPPSPRAAAVAEPTAAWRATFGSLVGEDLRAAVLLMAAQDVRSATTKGDTPFDQSLNFVQTLLGDSTPSGLVQLIDTVTPAAKRGVATYESIQQEFTTMAATLTTQAMTNANLSWFEQAQMRLHGLIQIERDGVPLMGTPLQRTLDRARGQVRTGDVAGALLTLQALDSGAAATINPWMQRAEDYVRARDVTAQLIRAVSAHLSLMPAMQNLTQFSGGQVDPNAVMRGLIQSLGTP
jgi:uroporphyrinogen-III synthase